MAVPLLLLIYVNESQFTYAILTTFDLNHHNEKLFDLHMFIGNITNGIVTVNGYHKQ